MTAKSLMYTNFDDEFTHAYAILCSACKDWWSQSGSNRWPHECHPCALPTELWPQPIWYNKGSSTNAQVHRKTLILQNLRLKTSWQNMSLRRQGFLDNRISYTIVRQHWCNFTITNTSNTCPPTIIALLIIKEQADMKR